jgi:hypothetical protein
MAMVRAPIVTPSAHKPESSWFLAFPATIAVFLFFISLLSPLLMLLMLFYLLLLLLSFAVVSLRDVCRRFP